MFFLQRPESRAKRKSPNGLGVGGKKKTEKKKNNVKNRKGGTPPRKKTNRKKEQESWKEKKKKRTAMDHTGGETGGKGGGGCWKRGGKAMPKPSERGKGKKFYMRDGAAGAYDGPLLTEGWGNKKGIPSQGKKKHRRIGTACWTLKTRGSKTPVQKKSSSKKRTGRGRVVIKNRVVAQVDQGKQK